MYLQQVIKFLDKVDYQVIIQVLVAMQRKQAPTGNNTEKAFIWMMLK